MTVDGAAAIRCRSTVVMQRSSAYSWHVVALLVIVTVSLILATGLVIVLWEHWSRPAPQPPELDRVPDASVDEVGHVEATQAEHSQPRGLLGSRKAGATSATAWAYPASGSCDSSPDA